MRTFNLVVAAFALVQAFRYGPRAWRFARALARPEERRTLRANDAVPVGIVLVAGALLAAAVKFLLVVAR